MSNRTPKHTTEPAATHTDKPEVTFDPAAGEKAFHELLPRYSRLLPAELSPVTTSVADAAMAALAVARRIGKGALYKAFTEVAGKHFDIENLHVLEKAAWAAWYASLQWNKYRDTASEAKIPFSLAQESAEVEGRMQRCCEYYFEDDPELGPEVARLRPGTGHRDRAGDLMGYAAIYRAQHKVVSHDRKYYRPGDYDAAIRIAQEIFRLLGDQLSPEARAAFDNLVRAWTFLLNVYFEVRETGRWLERRDPRRDENYPSLYTAGKSVPARRKDSGAETGDAEAGEGKPNG